MLSILIVSDIRLYREGLTELLSREAALRVIGSAVRVDDALPKACELNPSVVVIDQSLPDCLTFSRTLGQLRPDIRVVALGVPASEESVLAFAEAGIAGYVPCDGSIQDLVEAVQRAARGELHCTPQMAGAIIRRLAWRAAGGSNAPVSPLTARESEIVWLIDQGRSNKEIAVHLGIEVATVKNHVHNVLEKLRVHRRAEVGAQLRSRDLHRPAPRRPPLIPE